jgi:sensor domain CHASE-containing protein
MNQAMLLFANESFLLIVLTVLVLLSIKNGDNQKIEKKVKDDLKKIKEQINHSELTDIS